MSDTQPDVDEQKSGWWDDYDMASLKDISNIMMDCCIDVMANAKRGKTTEEALNEVGDYVRKMADYIHQAKKDLLAEVVARSVEYDLTDLERMERNGEVLDAVPLAAIKEIEEGL